MEFEILGTIVKSAAIRLFTNVMDVVALWITGAVVLFGSLGLCKLL